MPNKFYNIVLQSGKKIWLNPDHVVVAEELYPNGWELTLVNGYKLDFLDSQKLDNHTLVSHITAKHPM